MSERTAGERRAPEREGQIILVSGGGWHYRGSGDRATDPYILRHTRGRRPRICLVAGAQGDQASQYQGFVHHLGREGFLSAAPIFSLLPGASDPREELLQADLIYMTGGNSAAIAGALRELDWLPALRQAVRGGATIAAVCASALALCEAMVFRWANGFGPPRSAAGLGLVRSSLSCHADIAAGQTALHERGVGNGSLPAGWALDDGAILRLSPRGRLLEAVTSVPGARAVRLGRRAGSLERRGLELTVLPGAA